MKPSRNDDLIHEATHVLRFMLYVGRTNMTPSPQENGSSVFTLGYHHARFAADTWEAIRGVQHHDGKVYFGAKKFDGVVLIAAPGHGKSEFATHQIALWLCQNPKEQIAHLHAADDIASEALVYLKAMFDDDSPSGRRCRALFPDVRLDRDRNNSARMFSLKTEERMRNPTVRSAGVMSARLGVSTQKQLWDDVVPQSDRDEPTTRERRTHRLAGTWVSRQRGRGFIMAIGTIWHRDDAISKMLEIGRRDGRYLISVQRCGGPSNGFRPLWPEVYPASALRAKFEQMNRDVNLWSCAYEANPIAEEARLVKKLRYYDPASEEHERFMASAVFHVSLDPAATNREGNDKAGLVYVAVGEVRVVRPDGTEVYQPRARVIDAQELGMNQMELVRHVEDFALGRPVGMIHAETKTGFAGIAHLFEERLGVVVQCHDPGNRSKGVRLKQCAGCIDDSHPEFRAVVEFPGLANPEGGEPVEDRDRWGWYYDQFLDFGVVGGFHALDASTQVLNYLLRNDEISPATQMAAVTRAARAARAVDDRLVEVFRRASDENGGDVHSDTMRWAFGRFRNGEA